MNMLYLLFIIITQQGDNTSVTAAEFKTLEACDKASKTFKKKVSSNKDADYITVYCQAHDTYSF